MLHAEWGHERVCDFKCEKCVRSAGCVHVCVLSSMRHPLPMVPCHELFLGLTTNRLLWFSHSFLDETTVTLSEHKKPSDDDFEAFFIHGIPSLLFVPVAQ